MHAKIRILTPQPPTCQRERSFYVDNGIHSGTPVRTLRGRFKRVLLQSSALNATFVPILRPTARSRDAIRLPNALYDEGSDEPEPPCKEPVDGHDAFKSSSASSRQRRIAELEKQKQELAAQFEKTAAELAELQQLTSSQRADILSAAREHMMDTVFADKEAALREEFAPSDQHVQPSQQREGGAGDEGTPMEADGGTAVLPLDASISGIEQALIEDRIEGPPPTAAANAPEQGQTKQKPQFQTGVGLRNVPIGVPKDVVSYVRDSGVAGDDFDWTPAEPPPGWPHSRRNAHPAELAPPLTGEHVPSEADGIDAPWAPKPPPQQKGGMLDGIGMEDDDESLPEDDIEFTAGDGVAEALSVLESGRLLEEPKYKTAPESPAAFKARIQEHIDRYEAHFLPRSKRRLSTQRIREMDAEWDLLEDLSAEDIEEVRPAPDLPPNIEAQWQRAQHIHFLLRRAHINEAPDEPHRWLHEAGLVADNVVFQDPFITAVGRPAWQDYMRNLRAAGCWQELANSWIEMSQERPQPEWMLYYDVHLTMPLPHWYFQYLATNHTNDPPHSSHDSSEDDEDDEDDEAHSESDVEDESDDEARMHSEDEVASDDEGKPAADAVDSGVGVGQEADVTLRPLSREAAQEALRQQPWSSWHHDPRHIEPQTVAASALAESVFGSHQPASRAAKGDSGEEGCEHGETVDSLWVRLPETWQGDLAAVVVADVCTSVNECLEPRTPVGLLLHREDISQDAATQDGTGTEGVRTTTAVEAPRAQQVASKKGRAVSGKNGVKGGGSSELERLIVRPPPLGPQPTDRIPLRDKVNEDYLHFGYREEQEKDEADEAREAELEALYEREGVAGVVERAAQEARDKSAEAATNRPSDRRIGYDTDTVKGEAWRTAEVLTLDLVIMYHIDAGTGQVDQIQIAWAGMHAKGLSEADIADVYLRQSGLLKWKYSEIKDLDPEIREDPLKKQQNETSPFA